MSDFIRVRVRLLRVVAAIRQRPTAQMVGLISLPWAQCVADILEHHHPEEPGTLEVIRLVRERWNRELPPPAGAGAPPWPEGFRRGDTPMWERYQRDRTILRERLLAEGVHPEDLGGLRV